jgi:conjugal transfer pilus assembly protein TraA
MKGIQMKKQNLAVVSAVALAALLASGAVLAGADTTFGTTAGAGPVGTLTNWLQGSMGRMFAIGALAVGLGIGIVKQSVMSVAIGVGIALAASAGPTVLGAIFSAAI